MDTVKVDREQLLVQLRENRTKHVNTFNEVLQAYFDRSVDILQEHIDRIRDGAVESVSVHLPEPRNYEEEYDKAIAMLEWSQDEMIELDAYNFDRYVLDKWSWQHDFMRMSETYTLGRGV